MPNLLATNALAARMAPLMELRKVCLRGQGPIGVLDPVVRVSEASGPRSGVERHQIGDLVHDPLQAPSKGSVASLRFRAPVFQVQKVAQRLHTRPYERQQTHRANSEVDARDDRTDGTTELPPQLQPLANAFCAQLRVGMSWRPMTGCASL